MARKARVDFVARLRYMGWEEGRRVGVNWRGRGSWLQGEIKYEISAKNLLFLIKIKNLRKTWQTISGYVTMKISLNYQLQIRKNLYYFFLKCKLLENLSKSTRSQLVSDTPIHPIGQLKKEQRPKATDYQLCYRIKNGF